MKNYRIKEENSDHFVIHDTKDKSEFKVAKAHLDSPMLARLSGIQRFDDGGDVKPKPGFNTSSDFDPNSTMPATNMESMPALPPDAPKPTVAYTDPDGKQFSFIDNKLVPTDTIPAGTPAMSPLPEQAPQVAQPQPAPQGAQLIPTSPQSMQGQPQMTGGGMQSMSDPYQQYLQSMQGATNQQMQANTDIAKATKQVADEQARIEAGNAVALQNAQQLHEKYFNETWQENQNLTKQIANTQIDPNHYWNDASVGSKIGMLASMIVSGFGGGAGQGNMAAQILEKNIDRDIDSQKANLGKTQNLLSNNLAKFGNLESATNATRLNLLAITQGQVQAAAAKQGGAIAQANAQNFNGEILKSMAGLTKDTAMQRMALDFYRQNPNPQGQTPLASNPNQPGTLQSGIDQNRYMTGKFVGAINPKDEPEIQKEMDRYEKLRGALNFIDEQTGKLKALQTGSNYFQHPIDTNVDTQRLKDNIATAASKDAEQKVNELALKSNRGQTQDLIDSPESAQLGIENLKDSARMLHGSESFPLMTGQYHLLNPNDPVLLSATRQKQMLSNKFKPGGPPPNNPQGMIAKTGKN